MKVLYNPKKDIMIIAQNAYSKNHIWRKVEILNQKGTTLSFVRLGYVPNYYVLIGEF